MPTRARRLILTAVLLALIAPACGGGEGPVSVESTRAWAQLNSEPILEPPPGAVELLRKSTPPHRNEAGRERHGSIEITWVTRAPIEELEDHYLETYGDRYLLDREYRAGRQVRPVAGSLVGHGRRDVPYRVRVKLLPQPPPEVLKRPDLMGRLTSGPKTFVTLGVTAG